MNTAMRYLDTQLKDDGKQTGGISFRGETLRDFIDNSGDIISYDDDLDTINAALCECGIMPVGETDTPELCVNHDRKPMPVETTDDIEEAANAIFDGIVANDSVPTFFSWNVTPSGYGYCNVRIFLNKYHYKWLHPSVVSALDNGTFTLQWDRSDDMDVDVVKPYIVEKIYDVLRGIFC